MESGYDENLAENLFFKHLRNEYENLYRKAIAENWLICVPCSQSLDNYRFDERDMLTHILLPTDELPETHFLNLNDNLVTLFDNSVRFQDDRPVPILFVEIFYSEESRYRVLCLERPLNFEDTAMRKRFNPRIYPVRTLDECVDLLHSEGLNESVIEKIKNVINQFLFLSCRDYFCKTVKQQAQFARLIYERCFHIVLQDEKIAFKAKISRMFADNVRVAVESYVLNDIYSIVMKGLVSALTPEIASFNKALRTLSHVQLQDVTIKPSTLEGVMKARANLAFINKCTTVLGKLNCLKQTINLLSMEQNAAKPSVDELLPVLVFLVAKSGITTWIAQLQYVKDFNFSQADLNQTNEYNFLVTTLEAVLTFIRSGLFFRSISCSTQDDRSRKVNEKTCRKSQSFWETKNENLSRLFELIYDDDMDGVRQMFEVEITDKILVRAEPQYCHPLCSCDNCERLRMDCGEPQTAPFTVNSVNGNGCSALHVAACYGRSAILDWLLGAGADPNCVDFSGSTPLHCAASHGHQNIVLLLAYANAALNRRDDDGNAPLHLACLNGHLDCAKALLYFTEHAGIPLDVNMANNDYDTPLHLATRYYYADIIRLLLNYNGNPNIKNKRNNNAFELTESLSIRAALNDRSTTVVDLMTSPLEVPIRWDENKFSKKFKARDISNDKFGVPPQDAESIKNADKLFKAIRVCNMNLVKQLLGFGNGKPSARRSSNANILSQSYKCHPLCQCAECLDEESVREYVDSDGDDEHADFYKIDALSVNICDSEGLTPLHLACKYGHVGIIQFLLDVGARANARTYRLLSTPLHIAALSGQFSAVKLLLECGKTVCELDGCDRNGNTALHHACAAGNSRMVELLLQYYPNTELRNNYGKTPINEGEEILSYVIMQMLQKPRSLSQEELLS